MDVGVAVAVEVDEDVAAGEAADNWLIAIQGNFITIGNTSVLPCQKQTVIVIETTLFQVTVFKLWDVFMLKYIKRSWTCRKGRYTKYYLFSIYYYPFSDICEV